jgi:NADPH-dependent 2,4-dienoyl-CoA reductase/sulfur reductase-like enzyme
VQAHTWEEQASTSEPEKKKKKNYMEQSRDARPSVLRCCVIGAGPSGLAVAKALLDQRDHVNVGIEVVVFEQSDQVGGKIAIPLLCSIISNILLSNISVNFNFTLFHVDFAQYFVS